MVKKLKGKEIACGISFSTPPHFFRFLFIWHEAYCGTYQMKSGRLAFLHCFQWCGKVNKSMRKSRNKLMSHVFDCSNLGLGMVLNRNPKICNVNRSNSKLTSNFNSEQATILPFKLILWRSNLTFVSNILSVTTKHLL